jgi:hypothetical protein
MTILNYFEEAGLPRKDFNKPKVTYRLIEKVLVLYKSKSNVSLEALEMVLM